MSLGTELYTKLKNDSGIDAIVDGHVYGAVIPDVLDVTQTIIVFAYDQEEGWNTLEAYNVLEIYSLVVVLFSQDTDEIETLSAAVRSCLDSYSTDSILDVQYEGHTNEPDSERDRFTRIMNYKIIYNNI